MTTPLLLSARPPVRSRFVVVVCAVAFAACGDDLLAPSVDPEVEAFAEAMNDHRLGVGCVPLVWNAPVADVAEAHSQDMIDRDFFAHTNPDGASPFDRLGAAGITYSSAAENIAFGYPDAAAVLQGWLNSPGHRNNIESCSLTTHGVGLVGTHWTHLFVTP